MSETGNHDKHSPSRPEFEILVNAADPAFVEFARTEFQRAGVSAGFQSFAGVDEVVSYLRREGEYPRTDLIIVDLSVSNEFVKMMKDLSTPFDIPILFASASAQATWMELLSFVLASKTVTQAKLQWIC